MTTSVTLILSMKCNIYFYLIYVLFELRNVKGLEESATGLTEMISPRLATGLMETLELQLG
jgi:hypothetical protein